jgi:hypothetical protein
MWVRVRSVGGKVSSDHTDLEFDASLSYELGFSFTEFSISVK